MLLLRVAKSRDRRKALFLAAERRQERGADFVQLLSLAPCARTMSWIGHREPRNQYLNMMVSSSLNLKRRNMSFSRRQFLLSGISLSGILLNPLKAFSWGSFDGIANTHQLIVKNAMQGLLKDPVMKFNLFPSEKDILNSDWVNGIYGTGPDVEGFSNYSDHYYNPKIENKGNGPNASGTQFHNLILKLSQSSNDKTAAKCAAWAAHFLNDMHVPYHVIGITGREAYIKYNRGHEYLTPDESGPLVLYGPQLKAKPGWGQNQNFLLALERYVEKHISARGEVGLVDWHDPWYDNGIGIGLANTVFGSHSKWELLAHRGWSYEKAKKFFKSFSTNLIMIRNGRIIKDRCIRIHGLLLVNKQKTLQYSAQKKQGGR